MADEMQERMQQLNINEGRTNPERGPNDDTEPTGGHPGGTRDVAGGRRRDRDNENDFNIDPSDNKEMESSWCKMGLLNIRSINKKQSRISNFIQNFKLKALMLTETWLTPENGDQHLGEILPNEFRFHHQSKESQIGGGVAILHSKELKTRRVKSEDTSFESFKSFESFEYVAVDLHHDKWTRPIWTVTVYRRPGGNDEDMRKFLEEFQNLLNKFSKDDSILITGDFNIKVNDENNKHATWFKKLLEDNGLRQHVREPTHNRGNTLDLVITRNVDISNLRVKEPIPKNEIVIDRNTQQEKEKSITLSDHYLVIFSARPTSSSTK